MEIVNDGTLLHQVFSGRKIAGGSIIYIYLYIYLLYYYNIKVLLVMFLFHG